ncbi:MAG: VWA domain-containing protein [Cocleimonas sp.]|nr:VWA domain-containing protein [Cocleimonas sp.]
MTLSKQKKFIGQFGASGFTNYVSALEEGIALLKQATKPIQYGIFFSDGLPEPSGQDARIEELLTLFEPMQVPIYTVGLGSLDFFALQLISNWTGGKHYTTSNPNHLALIFQKIADKYKNLLTTRNISIEGSLTNPLQPVAGSFSHSVISRGTSDNLKNRLDQAGKVFESTGKMLLPPIPVLENKALFTYRFNIKVDICDQLKDITVPVHDPSSKISYNNGEPASIEDTINYAEVTVKKCDLIITKTLTRDDDILNIRILNICPFPIWDVNVYEILSGFFAIGNAKFLSPPPVQVNHDKVTWILPLIKSDEHIDMTLQMIGVPNNPGGRLKVQHETESQIKYSSIGKSYSVQQDNPNFSNFKANMESSSTGTVVDPALKSLIEKEFWPGHKFTSGDVDITSVDFADAGFDYEIELTHKTKEITGTVFVKIEKDHIKLHADKQTRDPIPQVFTPSNWSP